MIPRLKKLVTLLERRDKLHLVGVFGLMLIGAFLDMAGVGVIPAFVATPDITDSSMYAKRLASSLLSSQPWQFQNG